MHETHRPESTVPGLHGMIRAGVLITALSLAVPVVAQQYVDQGGGRALDANPGAGSGGINSQVNNQINNQFNNDLVTGNVSGGREFRGDVGYTAPGAFRGELGSDDLFRFNATSIPQLPGQAPIAAYEYASTPTAAFSSGVAAPSNYYIGGNVVTGLVNQENPGRRNLVTNNFNNSSTTTLTLFRDQSGAVQSLNASSLFGLRSSIQSVADPFAAPASFSATEDPNNPTGYRSGQVDRSNTGAAREAAVDGTAQFAADAQRDQTAFQSGFANTGSISLALGRELQATDDPNTVGVVRFGDTPSDNSQATVAQLQETLFGPEEGEPAGPDVAAAESGSVYDQLIRDIPGADGDGFDAIANPLSEPTEDEVRSAEEILAELRAQLYGGSSAENDPNNPDATPAGPATGLAELMEQLNYDLPRIQSLAAENESQLARYLREAEDQLADGDYFEADRSYLRATLLDPADPMPQMGRVHALLGSGMIRASALHLRRIFENHPELIAARYETRLLPNDEDLRNIQDDLNRLASQNSSANAAGIMTAYLGYQLNSATLVRYGLALAESAAPGDPLIPVLRRIWGDD